MNKRLKKVVAIILTAAIAMTTSAPVFASTSIDDTEDIVAVVVKNGIATPFTESEYDQYLKDQGRAITAKELMEGNVVVPDGQLPETVIENDTVTNVMPRYTVYESYDESSGNNAVRYSMAKAVTPLTNGNEDGSTVSYGESVTFTESLTAEATLTSAIKEYVIGELGASYSISASNNSSFGVTMNIAAGKVARVMFAPAMRYTDGQYVKRTVYNNNGGENLVVRNITGYIPIKVGNFADGEYYLQYV